LSQIFASWNLIRKWLSRLEQLRLAALTLFCEQFRSLHDFADDVRESRDSLVDSPS